MPIQSKSQNISSRRVPPPLRGGDDVSRAFRGFSPTWAGSTPGYSPSSLRDAKRISDTAYPGSGHSNFSGMSNTEASPEGCRKVAGGNTPGVACPRVLYPGRVLEHGNARSPSPKVPLVVFDPMLLEKGDVFLTESPRTVMFLLPRDIGANVLDRRFTHGERPISVLPVESGDTDLRVNPFGRLTFHVAGEFGKFVFGPKLTSTWTWSLTPPMATGTPSKFLTQPPK